MSFLTIYLVNQGTGGSISVENGNLFTADNLVVDGFELNATSYDLAGWQSMGYGDESALAPLMDVLFENPAGDEYRLNSDTVAIDLGRAVFQGLNAPAVDIDGTVRPQDDGYDIGAYESTFGSGVATTPAGRYGKTAGKIPLELHRLSSANR